jgi:hypothetical protein
VVCKIVLPEQVKIITYSGANVKAKSWKKTNWKEMKSWMLSQNLDTQLAAAPTVENRKVLNGDQTLRACGDSQRK